MKIAAGYYRVSTQEQDFARQVSKVHEYAKQNGYTITDEFFDKASGKDPDREQFIKLQEWVRLHPNTTVLAAELDRLSRGFEGYISIKSACESARVNLIPINVPASGNVESDEFISYILMAFANYERRLIVNRLFSGRLSKIRSGNPIMGRVSYGYRYYKRQDDAPAKIEIDTDEASIVKEIFYLFNGGQTLYAIQRELNSRNIPTKTKKGTWEANTIKTILSNASYLGEVFFNKRKFTVTKEKKHIKEFKDKKDWIAIKVPELIDKTTFLQTQALLQRPQHKPQNKKYNYLLGGLVHCGLCGKKYSAYKSGNGCRFYRCSSRSHGHSEKYCHNRTANAEKLEPYIWNMVSSILYDPDNAIGSYVRSKKEVLKTHRYLQDKVESLNKKFDELDRGEDRLAEGLARGLISLATLEKQQKNLEKQRNAIADEMATYVDELTKLTAEMTIVDREKIVENAKELMDKKEDTPFETKVSLVQRYVKKIIVLENKNEYTVEFMIPVKPITVNVEQNKVDYYPTQNAQSYRLVVKHITTPSKYQKRNPITKVDMTSAPWVVAWS